MAIVGTFSSYQTRHIEIWWTVRKKMHVVFFFSPQWAVQTLTRRENVVMSEVKHDWKPTYWSYADVVSWGQMVGKRLIIAVICTNKIWNPALRSAPLRAEWWSVQRPDDKFPYRQTRASHETITQMFLIQYPSVTLQFPHVTSTASPNLSSPFTLLFPFFLPFSSLCCLSRQ